MENEEGTINEKGNKERSNSQKIVTHLLDELKMLDSSLADHFDIHQS